MVFKIIRFPGSNCERDCFDIVTRVLGSEGEIIEAHLREPGFDPDCDCVILPGGFSYGDYLRAGAIAKAAPIIPALKEHADRGGLVLGICNGFQILCEIGLLPGALLTNQSGTFICQEAVLRVAENQNPYTNSFSHGELIHMPVAHAQGNYFVPADQLNALRAKRQIILEYVENINGSQIAGVSNESGNVFGLMPHPERCCEKDLGGIDGLRLFKGILRHTPKLAIMTGN
ncbi:MAG: phosphoribosylformylglycinamidine synthase subunit PurQ [Candidatus Caenarcaniphilales bacterium]|nr:phosphoribosylformylglycinamidine synthase subunit PurQ [Candidatus Caenarcaniphilales bacterium]